MANGSGEAVADGVMVSRWSQRQGRARGRARGMINPADSWFMGRHKELLREAGQQHLAREARRTRKGRSRAQESETCTPPARAVRPDAPARKYPVVRLERARDAPRIAVLLELNGMPRWVAFEERFIVAEQEGRLAAAVRFREGSEGLHLGLLVTDPWAGEGPLVAALYAEARAIAVGLGLREIRARTRRHQTHLRAAGYRRRRGGWWLGVSDTAG